MMIKAISAFLLLAAGALAQLSVPLWPASSEPKPELVTAPVKPNDSTHVSGIHNPSLVVYLPPKDKATGAAMIVAPGGGHRFLSIDTEGTNVAAWLNSIGVAAFVLKYRLAREEGSPYKVEDAYADGQRSVRMVRARAQEWNVNAAKIGIMGFSAGGEVAAVTSLKFDAGQPDAADPIDRQSSRPDFQILIYPGIRAENMIVPKDAPPTFLLAADNDKGPSTAIPALYLALKKEGIPAELHIYASGGHGFGLRPHDPRPNVIYSTWTTRLQDWMADVGMLPHERP